LFAAGIQQNQPAALVSTFSTAELQERGFIF
jgi:hypothetical protein